MNDVDLPNRRVWAHGGGYRFRDRWITLEDDWCVAAIARRIEVVRSDPRQLQTADPWLVYRPHPTTPTEKRQAASIGPTLTGLLKTAGVYEPGVIRVESIREWLAARVFAETGRIEDVALRLGMSSLDAAAHLVGYEWATDLTPDVPPAHRRGEVGEA